MLNYKRRRKTNLIIKKRLKLLIYMYDLYPNKVLKIVNQKNRFAKTKMIDSLS